MSSAATTIEHQDGRVSTNAAESSFHEIDDRDRAIPAIEFRDVYLAFDDRTILKGLCFKVMKGETKIILAGDSDPSSPYPPDIRPFAVAKFPIPR